MNYSIFGASLLITLLTLAYLFVKWKYNYWKRKGVLQFEPELFYGNVRDMVKGDKSVADTFLEYYKKFKAIGVKYGGLYAGFNQVFFPISPSIIKDIMQKNFDHFMAHMPVVKRDFLTKSLFHLEGDAWRKTRKELTPTFTSGKMKMMFETLLEKTISLGDLVGEFTQSKDPVDIKEILERFTSDVVGSVGFGVDCNAIADPNSEFLKYGKIIFDPPEKDTFWKFIVRALGIRRYRKDIKPVETFFTKIVKDTITYREENEVYRKDFLHLMIQLKNRGTIYDDDKIFSNNTKMVKDSMFDEEYIVAQCFIFFIAGFETSATTMTFALFELAQNPDIQDKVRKEANDILKKYNGKMTYEAMLELVYTEQVIRETLRKYPPVSTIPRVCTKDYIIPGTDIVVEKGTLTHIPCYGLHMDPEYFPEPEKFNPERFNEENKKNIKDFTYIPFGEGPRMCIGMRFGLMQTKVGLLSLVKDYKFTLNKSMSLPLKLLRDVFVTGVDGKILVDVEKV